jgi:hypothetical protein
MKAKCEVCGVEGFLEKRGNSYRIRHYVGYDGNQRKCLVHRISNGYASTLGINGNQLVIRNHDNSFKSENLSSIVQCSGSIVRSSIAASRHLNMMGESRGPGSKSRPEHHLVRLYYDPFLMRRLLTR